MEKYLNIGNLFDGGIGFSVRHTSEQVRAGTHAINSHDELVAMNKELLAALEEISNLPSYRQDECSEMAREAIAKAKGTA